MMKNRSFFVRTLSSICLAGIITLGFITLQGCGGGDNPFSISFTTSFTIATGDLNGDGLNDVVIGHSGFGAGSYLSVRLQNTSSPGSFATANLLAVRNNSPEVTDLKIGDLNGDGRLDIVVATSDGDIIVYPQDPAQPGRFLSETIYRTGRHTHGITIGDLNGDGKPDIAAANGGTGNGISILFHDAASPNQFLPSTKIAVGPSGVGSIALGDINGDGMLDIAVTIDIYAPGTIAVLLQDPLSPGTFGPPVELPPGVQHSNISLADLNGDGKLDIVTSTWNLNVISVLLQDQSHPGIFLSEVNYPVASQPGAIAIGDLNSDGKPDLAVANYGSKNVTILLQNYSTAGTFLSAVNYSTQDAAFFAAIADLNGDGRNDIAVAASTVNMLLFQDPGHLGMFSLPFLLELG